VYLLIVCISSIHLYIFLVKGHLNSERHNLTDQLTLYKAGRTDYAQRITVCPLGFKKLSKPL
jgi:hypothetical protein